MTRPKLGFITRTPCLRMKPGFILNVHRFSTTMVTRRYPLTWIKIRFVSFVSTSFEYVCLKEAWFFLHDDGTLLSSHLDMDSLCFTCINKGCILLLLRCIDFPPRWWHTIVLLPGWRLLGRLDSRAAIGLFVRVLISSSSNICDHLEKQRLQRG